MKHHAFAEIIAAMLYYYCDLTANALQTNHPEDLFEKRRSKQGHSVTGNTPGAAAVSTLHSFDFYRHLSCPCAKESGRRIHRGSLDIFTWDSRARRVFGRGEVAIYYIQYIQYVICFRPLCSATLLRVYIAHKICIYDTYSSTDSSKPHHHSSSTNEHVALSRHAYSYAYNIYQLIYTPCLGLLYTVYMCNVFY